MTMQSRYHRVLKTAVPQALLAWNKDVKEQELIVEKAMFTVIRLTYVIREFNKVKLPEETDVRGRRSVQTRRKTLRKAYNKALTNLENVLEKEYIE